MQDCHEFVVDYRPCLILSVKVIRVRNIMEAWPNSVDTPNPVIEFKIPNTPDAQSRTSPREKKLNAEWNEHFRYLLDPKEKNILHITLKRDDSMCDETIGSECMNINVMERNKWIKKTIPFKQEYIVDIDLKAEIEGQPNLRFGEDLCEEEMKYLKHRKLKTLAGMGRLLGVRGPKTTEEVPTVAVMGSGGGFRAMVAYSGVFKALKDTGVLDCVTFACGLSGSSWFLSTLYSHKRWPKMSLEEFQEELKNNINTSLTNLLGRKQVTGYIKAMTEKWMSNQPISCTDFFGHLLGEELLKDRKDCKLTDQQIKIFDGDIPMPLYTCVNVKTDISARDFHEWVEFSPFEIGMAKFGSFMKSEYFGSKFFMGKLVKKYDEPPLHFLQGIWGSAFCALFNELFYDKHDTQLHTAMIRREMKQTDAPTPAKRRKTTQEVEQAAERTAESTGFWENCIKALVESNLFAIVRTRIGRAGGIYNFLRHISLLPKCEGPETVGERDSGENVTQSNDTTVYSTRVEKLLLVDAGLVFNSPYPLVLRQARAVDIILSFDFSSREKDDSDVFEQLKSAEKWAKHHRIPFPPIDSSVSEEEEMKELYIFRDPNDPHCPIILHFVLVNLDFQKYTKPSAPRETDEEKQFADFTIFGDPEAPYSTFNFTYTHKAFDRLSQLMEFNTLNHLLEIKDTIAEVVLRKRK